MELRGGRIRVGREPGLELYLDDPSVSRRHAELDFEPTRGWAVSDSASTNGTYSRGVRIERAAVIAGDELRFGDLTFTVESALGPMRAPDPGPEPSPEPAGTFATRGVPESAGPREMQAGRSDRSHRPYAIERPERRISEPLLEAADLAPEGPRPGPLAEELLPFAQQVVSEALGPLPEVGRRIRTEAAVPDGLARRLDSMRAVTLGLAILLVWPLIFFRMSTAGLERQVAESTAPGSRLELAKAELRARDNLQKLAKVLPFTNRPLAICNSGSRDLRLTRFWAIWAKNLTSEDPLQRLDKSNSSCGERFGRGLEIPTGGQAVAVHPEDYEGCLGPDGAVAASIQILESGRTEYNGLVVLEESGCVDLEQFAVHPVPAN